MRRDCDGSHRTCKDLYRDSNGFANISTNPDGILKRRTGLKDMGRSCALLIPPGRSLGSSASGLLRVRAPGSSWALVAPRCTITSQGCLGSNAGCCHDFVVRVFCSVSKCPVTRDVLAQSSGKKNKIPPCGRCVWLAGWLVGCLTGWMKDKGFGFDNGMCTNTYKGRVSVQQNMWQYTYR